MNNYNEIKRKNYRFPAYDDKEGVKLHREGKRNLFANDRSWLTPRKTTTDATPVQEATVPSRSAASDKEERTLRRSRKETLDKQGLTIRQKTELQKHRDNLPDYSKKITAETDAVGRTSLFGKEPRKSALRNPATPKKTDESLKREYSGRSYFVPKYIPASVLPDESDSKEKVSSEELLSSLKKPQDSYLMFDQEVSAYQEKRNEDPTVKKFPATEVAEEEPATKRKGILERGLQGLINDETVTPKNKGYFTKKE